MASHSPQLHVLRWIAVLAIGTGGARAVGHGEGGKATVPRDVVMLVGATAENIEARDQDPARQLLQMPLNHLGLRLIRHGVERPMPPPDVDPSQVRAIGTWFAPEQELPEWVWPWLERQGGNVRVLHFGSLLPLARDDHGRRLRRHLERFGLGYDDAQIGDPARVEVEYARPDCVPFESRPVYELLHVGPWSVDPHNVVWLRTRDRARPRVARCPVVTGAWGGIALQPWFLRIGGMSDDRRFYVDPFRFLSEALQLDGLPVPDPCVRFGRRVFVLHVDGDGFESASTVSDGRMCGEVFLERVVDRWQVPMTVSFIVASLTEELHPQRPTPRMLLAREILARPWVEAASHSVLHPLDWRKQLHPRSLPRSVVWYPGLEGYEHDMVAEVRESIAFVDRWLVPAGGRCRVMLWSGAANPTREALAAASAAGCLNLNGGLFRWDDLHASVGFVSPWGVAIGDEFQVFAGAPNENVFAGFFSTMPGAFAHVDRTIENTGRGRILKPANVYCHFYSVENPARLAALESLLQRWLDREPVIPVPASTYAAAVVDCERACTVTHLEDGFHLTGFTHCRTVRFDGDVPAIDWARSRGLAGVRRADGRTFVHLASDVAELRFLADTAQPKRQPHVEQADCELTDVRLVADGVRFAVPAGRRRNVVLAGLPDTARVIVRGLPASDDADLHSDASGRIELRLPAGDRLELAVEAAR